MQKQGTLVYVFKGNEILLGCKKYGGAKGKLNGFGGKLEEGETPKEAAIREVYEETTLKIKELELHGIIHFHWLYKEEVMDMYVYRSYDFEGVPIESNEMTVKWFDINSIPKEKMWESDKYWFDFVLQEKQFEIDLYYESENSEMFDRMGVRFIEEIEKLQ